MSAGYPHPQTLTRSIIRTNTNLSDHLPVWPPPASLPLLPHATEKCMSGIPRHERFHPRTYSILIACTYLILFLVTICLLGYPFPRPHIPLAPTFLFPFPPSAYTTALSQPLSSPVVTCVDPRLLFIAELDSATFYSPIIPNRLSTFVCHFHR